MMKILTFSSLPSARIVVVLEACSCKLQHAISSTTRSSSAAACIMQLSSLYHAAQQPVSCSAAAVHSLAEGSRGTRLDLVEGGDVDGLDEILVLLDLLLQLINGNLVVFNDATDLKLVDSIGERDEL